MRTSPLGRTGFRVSELCFGALPLGPLQLNLPLETGVSLIREAVRAGINFIDTAHGYNTYRYIKPALSGITEHVYIASKSTALTWEEMDSAVRAAQDGLGRKCIDIFHFHAPRTGSRVLEERPGALECLIEHRRRGVIRAIGLATHSVEAAKVGAVHPDIDVLFPILNVKGLGIIDGTLDEMVDAVALAGRNGKGIYAMKALGGGNILSDVEEAFRFVRSLEAVCSVAVGMVSMAELKMNLDIFENRQVQQKAPVSEKRFQVQWFCTGCGECVPSCAAAAISLVDAKAHIDQSACICCGYCAPGCPQFAIRMV